MESIISNIEYDMLLQITKPSSSNIKPEFGGGKPRKSDYFTVVCRSNNST
jgi:hypothetical protein